MSERPKVGVGLLIVKGDQVLLGKRKGAHGEGEYAGAGGHVEHLESFEQTALRELKEEVGDEFEVTNMRFLCLTNMMNYAPKHYVDIGMIADWVSGEPKVMEPEKIEFWDWYAIDDLPGPLFSVIKNYVQAYKTGKVYFSSD